MTIDNNRKVGISFSDAIRILEQEPNAPFLCEINEEDDNELHIIISCSEIIHNKDIPEHSDNTVLDEILQDCKPIKPSKIRKFELVFEDYIIYQVRNESYCSYDPSEIRIGKYLIEFEKSKLLDYLSISTYAQQLDNGEFFPYQWKHYGVYTQNHIIDIISHINPQIYMINTSIPNYQTSCNTEKA